MFHFTSHKIINISHPIIESIFHQTRQRKKNSIDKSFCSTFTKHWNCTSIFLKFVALPFPIFRISYMYMCMRVSIYIFPIIYSRHTHKRFSCFLVPQKLARNHRTSGVSEKSERAAVWSRRVYLCYATRFGTKCLIFLSVFFFSFFSFFFIYIHLSFSFYNAKNRDLALASISIVSLLSGIEISEGRTSVSSSTFASLFILNIYTSWKSERCVKSFSLYTHQLRCNVIVEQSPPSVIISAILLDFRRDSLCFFFCAEIRFNF